MPILYTHVYIQLSVWLKNYQPYIAGGFTIIKNINKSWSFLAPSFEAVAKGMVSRSVPQRPWPTVPCFQVQVLHLAKAWPMGYIQQISNLLPKVTSQVTFTYIHPPPWIDSFWSILCSPVLCDLVAPFSCRWPYRGYTELRPKTRSGRLSQ